MIVAVASGKGGTGKTTVCASLASVWERPAVAVDLDVEEPNLHLFLRPVVRWREAATLETPVADPARCTLCRKCTDLCQFKAVAVLGKRLAVFPEMCHGCGGCLAVCPEGALGVGSRELGSVEGGETRNGHYLAGRLRVGEAMSPPLQRAVKARLASILSRTGGDALLDCPPGVSCPAVNAVRDAHVILLVAEPTPFGIHDFTLALEAFAPLGKPMGVVINRAGHADSTLTRLCAEKGVPVLLEIPYDREIAREYASGGVLAAMNPRMAARFADLRDALPRLIKEAAHA
ncbi:Iron-sulfur cluster carrier protein [Fundidesulfovibrio magnetotacticus]|uniref:Iron-sulfur cluster carrier protein n=1 Tax=Fundidesulfovibrio magnetotacticus TaxID=2730080 RepID=A0A6V8LU34_9BACT|nr:ATP-binding protein [Fundidesulfovibrio magnetotacticus]GFK94460.1 Iron-sulfur cluster carrier protein [Fundidesulfovibrio magnetotacticus]